MNTHKLSRRTFLQMSALSAAGAALAACAAPAPGAAGGEAAPAASNELSWWMWNTFAPEADEVLEAKLNEWAAANGVTIEISRDSDSNQADKVMPALEAGTLPDGLFTGADVALQMMAAGGTASLQDVFAEVGEAHEGWLPRLEEYVTRESDIHFLPYSIDTPMVHFRQDILEAAGAEIPEGHRSTEQVVGIVPEKIVRRDVGIELADESFDVLRAATLEPAAGLVQHAFDQFRFHLLSLQRHLDSPSAAGWAPSVRPPAVWTKLSHRPINTRTGTP